MRPAFTVTSHGAAFPTHTELNDWTCYTGCAAVVGVRHASRESQRYFGLWHGPAAGATPVSSFTEDAGVTGLETGIVLNLAAGFNRDRNCCRSRIESRYVTLPHEAVVQFTCRTDNPVRRFAVDGQDCPSHGELAVARPTNPLRTPVVGSLRSTYNSGELPERQPRDRWGTAYNVKWAAG